MAADDGSPGTADTSVQASTQSGLTVTPSEISFGTVSVGDRETTTVTVANESPETIMVGDVRVSGDTSAFEITNPDVERIRQLNQPIEAPPNTSQPITLAFSPDSPGEYRASLEVLDPDGNVLVSASATGTAAAGEVTVSQRSLTFKGTTVGSTATRVVTVVRDGDRQLSVSETVIRGSSAYTVRDGGSFDLDPGESKRLTVAFAPESTEPQQALLELHTSDPEEPVVPITLSNVDTQTRIDAKQRESDRRVDVSVSDARAGERVDVTMPSSTDESDAVAVDQMSVTPARDGNLTLNVTDSEDPLSTTPALATPDNATGLRYLNVTHSISNDDIEAVQYRYRVRKDRVANVTVPVNDTGRANPEAITMYRHTGDGWEEQSTRYIGETETHYVYVTNGTGFSEWTTAAKRPDISVAEATAEVDTLTVDETLTIQVTLTNDGGADGVFLTELYLDGSVVDQRRPTVPSGGTIAVAFNRQISEAGTYQVTVNDVPVKEIEVTAEGDISEETPSGDQQTSDGDDDDTESSGLSPSFPVVLGVGAVLLLGAIAGLLFARSGSADHDGGPDSDDDESVVQVEGFDEASGAGEGDGLDAGDGDESDTDDGDGRDVGVDGADSDVKDSDTEVNDSDTEGGDSDIEADDSDTGVNGGSDDADETA